MRKLIAIALLLKWIFVFSAEVRADIFEDVYPLYDFKITISIFNYDNFSEVSYAPMACTLYGPEKLSVAGDLYLDLPEVANDLEIQCVTGEGQSVRLQNVERVGWFDKFEFFKDYFIFKWPVAVVRHVDFRHSVETYSDLIQLVSQDGVILKEYDPEDVSSSSGGGSFGINSERFYAQTVTTFFLWDRKTYKNEAPKKSIEVFFDRTITFE